MKNYKSIYTELLEKGFKVVTEDFRCCVFKTETKIAYVYHLGLGKGFEIAEYEIIGNA